MASSRLMFGSPLRELRIHLCQKSDASKGVREFIENHYVSIKKNNLQFPILIRECSGIYPKVYARYAGGKESSLPLSGLNSDQVLRAIQTLTEKK